MVFQYCGLNQIFTQQNPWVIERIRQFGHWDTPSINLSCFMFFLNKVLSLAVSQPKNSVYFCIFTSCSALKRGNEDSLISLIFGNLSEHSILFQPSLHKLPRFYESRYHFLKNPKESCFHLSNVRLMASVLIHCTALWSV